MLAAAEQDGRANQKLSRTLWVQLIGQGLVFQGGAQIYYNVALFVHFFVSDALKFELQ